MTVGTQASQADINQALTGYATQLRNLMRNISQFQQYLNSPAVGLTGLEAMGFASAANPANPGGVSDAQYALNLASEMNNVAGVYFGTVQQGGSGGTGAINFNFDNALAGLWAGN